jgi:hypothetical protein
VGGFANRAEAQMALAKALARLGPSGRAATITLGELVDDYLELHQAEWVTIAKLRWLLGKATAVTIDLADNAVAIRAYEKVGFRPVGVLREYWRAPDGTWHDGLLTDLLASELDRK